MVEVVEPFFDTQKLVRNPIKKKAIALIKSKAIKVWIFETKEFLLLKKEEIEPVK